MDSNYEGDKFQKLFSSMRQSTWLYTSPVFLADGTRRMDGWHTHLYIFKFSRSPLFCLCREMTFSRLNKEKEVINILGPGRSIEVGRSEGRVFSPTITPPYFYVHLLASQKTLVSCCFLLSLKLDFSCLSSFFPLLSSSRGSS